MDRYVLTLIYIDPVIRVRQSSTIVLRLIVCVGVVVVFRVVALKKIVNYLLHFLKQIPPLYPSNTIDYIQNSLNI